MTHGKQSIREIVREQMKLEQHQRETHATVQQIEEGHADAYRQIVKLITGLDIFAHAAAVDL